MQVGKSKLSQKTREPYGKVTEVGQVPVAFQEVKELVKSGLTLIQNGDYGMAVEANRTASIVLDSIIAVTCANPGCLSQMAENMEVKS